MRLVVSDPHPAACHGCAAAGETVALRVQAADGQWGCADFCKTCAHVVALRLLDYAMGRKLAPVA